MGGWRGATEGGAVAEGRTSLGSSLRRPVGEAAAVEGAEARRIGEILEGWAAVGRTESSALRRGTLRGLGWAAVAGTAAPLAETAGPDWTISSSNLVRLMSRVERRRGAAWAWAPVPPALLPSLELCALLQPRTLSLCRPSLLPPAVLTPVPSRPSPLSWAARSGPCSLKDGLAAPRDITKHTPAELLPEH